MTETPVAASTSPALTLRRIASWRGIRALAWGGDVLYACRGYEIVSLQPSKPEAWITVANFRPAWWRTLTSRNSLTHRLMRDGFHALAILADQTMVGAVPGALVTRAPGTGDFRITHQIQRGTRPLHLTAVPGGTIYWGEYFDNRNREEVHIYASTDRGLTWQVAHTFPAGSIRHVHNMVYDRWADALWILTGDEGAECKIMRASCDLRSIDVVLSGNQQARAVAAIPTPAGLYLSTDTPSEPNHIYCLGRAGSVHTLADLASSSIYGCRVGDALFFSTMIEPSAVNTGNEVNLVGSRDGNTWHVLSRWKKDALPLRYFQYGNAFLPDGENATNYLAATAIAVTPGDQTTTLWEVHPA